MSEPECQATRYAPGPCSETPPKFEVVYFTGTTEADVHPTCFMHGLAEVDRHAASGGIARAELRERKR